MTHRGDRHHRGGYFRIESAPSNRRAFSGSWQWFAINAGTLVSFLLGYALASIGSDTLGGRVAFVIAALMGLLTLTGFGAASAVTMAEQFPAEVRVTGIALPYALSVTLFGGTSP